MLNGTILFLIELLNGTKQGAVLSPILFTLYIEGLLERLIQSGVGCQIGCTYAGKFGYADCIALLALGLTSLKRIIKICKVSELHWIFIFIIYYTDLEWRL